MRVAQGFTEELNTRIARSERKIDIPAWEASPYRPVPTIVDAARLLYARNGIADLQATRADVGNLITTTDAIVTVVAAARSQGKHAVVFVTGIPCAGRTLGEPNTVFGTNTDAAFLTGNLPLIFVMRAALERDARDQGRNARQARQETEGAIQPLMGFLRDNFKRQDAPYEHVIVFDEAQRAWDAAFGARKFGHPQSEAAMFLDQYATRQGLGSGRGACRERPGDKYGVRQAYQPGARRFCSALTGMSMPHRWQPSPPTPDNVCSPARSEK